MSDEHTRIEFDVTETGHFRAPTTWKFVAPKDGVYTPTDWETVKDDLALRLACLTPEQRLEVLSSWCTYCGEPAPCSCWNDE